jgi:hypothetical protein
MDSANGKVLQWLIVLFVVAATFAFKVNATGQSQDALSDIPISGYGFDGRVLAFSEAERTFLGGAEAIKHEYSQANFRLVVVVVDGSNNRHAVHDPMFCLRGAGFEITNQTAFPIINGHGELISLAKGAAKQKVAFWFSNGEQRYTAFSRYLFESAVNRLTLGTIGTQPRMVTVYSVGERIPNWSSVLDRFPVLMDI